MSETQKGELMVDSWEDLLENDTDGAFEKVCSNFREAFKITLFSVERGRWEDPDCEQKDS
jgi:hypothetical protein